jgi:hypothetical protein
MLIRDKSTEVTERMPCNEWMGVFKARCEECSMMWRAIQTRHEQVLQGQMDPLDCSSAMDVVA